MDTVNEVHVLTNVRLSQTQKFILAKLALPETTPHAVYSQITTNRDVVVDRNTLVELGLIYVDDDAEEAELTDEGMAALKSENLADETGSLTPEGEKYAYAGDMEELQKIAAQNAPARGTSAPQSTSNEPTSEPGPMGVSAQDTRTTVDVHAANAFGESWSMIQQIQEELKQKAFLSKQKKS